MRAKTGLLTELFAGGGRNDVSSLPAIASEGEIMRYRAAIANVPAFKHDKLEILLSHSRSSEPVKACLS